MLGCQHAVKGDKSETRGKKGKCPKSKHFVMVPQLLGAVAAAGCSIVVMLLEGRRIVSIFNKVPGQSTNATSPSARPSHPHACARRAKPEFLQHFRHKFGVRNRIDCVPERAVVYGHENAATQIGHPSITRASREALLASHTASRCARGWIIFLRSAIHADLLPAVVSGAASAAAKHGFLSHPARCGKRRNPAMRALPPEAAGFSHCIGAAGCSGPG